MVRRESGDVNDTVSRVPTVLTTPPSGGGLLYRVMFGVKFSSTIVAEFLS